MQAIVASRMLQICEATLRLARQFRFHAPTLFTLKRWNRQNEIAQFAGTALDWVHPFPIFTGIGMVIGYALLGAGWLVYKGEGALRDWAYARIPRLVIAIIVVYGIVNAVVQSVVQPKVVGNAVALSQTLTFFSVLLWAVVLGAIGTILAIPLTLLFRAILVDSDPRARIWRGVVEADALRQTASEHRAIYGALVERNPPLAQATALVHINTSESWLRDVLLRP